MDFYAAIVTLAWESSVIPQIGLSAQPNIFNVEHPWAGEAEQDTRGAGMTRLAQEELGL